MELYPDSVHNLKRVQCRNNQFCDIDVILYHMGQKCFRKDET